jgi:hypothetical protein
MKSELALCFTFSTIAARRYESGDQESAETSMANAEKAYETVIHFLSDTKHSTHLTRETIQEFTAELERLRDRLDGLISKFRKWSAISVAARSPPDQSTSPLSRIRISFAKISIMDDPAKPRKEPQVTTERYEFLTTDLEVCFTLAKLVEERIRLNDREVAKQALVKAERGYDTIRRFLTDVRNSEHRNEIETKLNQLRTSLDTLAGQLKS